MDDPEASKRDSKPWDVILSNFEKIEFLVNFGQFWSILTPPGQFW